MQWIPLYFWLRFTNQYDFVTFGLSLHIDSYRHIIYILHNIHIYTIHTYVCVCMYIHIYIYTHTYILLDKLFDNCTYRDTLSLNISLKNNGIFLHKDIIIILRDLTLLQYYDLIQCFYSSFFQRWCRFQPWIYSPTPHPTPPLTSSTYNLVQGDTHRIPK